MYLEPVPGPKKELELVLEYALPLDRMVIEVGHRARDRAGHVGNIAELVAQVASGIVCGTALAVFWGALTGNVAAQAAVTIWYCLVQPYCTSRVTAWAKRRYQRQVQTEAVFAELVRRGINPARLSVQR